MFVKCKKKEKNKCLVFVDSFNVRKYSWIVLS